MEWTISIALLLGLGTSLHCVGMCGPIAFSLGINAANKLKFTVKNLTYQFGRVTTYTVLGIILGIVGQGFSMAGLQQVLSITIGVLMIAFVVVPRIKSGTNFKIGFIENWMLKLKITLSKFLRKQDISSLYITGLLNGLLPCGMVYIALTASLAWGSFYGSALFMFLFGLGTIPLMFTTVLFGQIISLKQRQFILGLVPYITIFLGILFIIRGSGLSIPYISPSEHSLLLHGNAEHCVDPGHQH